MKSRKQSLDDLVYELRESMTRIHPDVEWSDILYVRAEMADQKDARLIPIDVFEIGIHVRRLLECE